MIPVISLIFTRHKYEKKTLYTIYAGCILNEISGIFPALVGFTERAQRLATIISAPSTFQRPLRETFRVKPLFRDIHLKLTLTFLPTATTRDGVFINARHAQVGVRIIGTGERLRTVIGFCDGDR